MKKQNSQALKEDVRTQAEKRSIMKERARKLGRETEDKTTQRAFTEIIVFRLASETYGIETKFVREVFPLKDFTPLPGTPPFVLGIVNVRGQIFSILDIKKFFNLPVNGLGNLNKLIIIHNKRMEFGILADEIEGMQNIVLDELQPALPTHTGIREDYLLGITVDRLIVLDADKLLSDKKIVINEELTQ